jgi:orotate phosphoribosyltransferase
MALDPAARAGLAQLVRSTGYEYRDPPFQLTSGGWSHDYVDGKHAVATGAALGGPTMGADALAHGVAILAGTAWFSVRKEPKGHGRGAWVEGARLREGDTVLVVEDVVSTGASLLRAVEQVRELGVEVVAATALLDRSPAVAERFAAAGIDWIPLLTWADLGIEPL